jgi:hypothetical protein
MNAEGGFIARRLVMGIRDISMEDVDFVAGF